MEKVEDQIEQDKVAFDAYKCGKCGEELMDMKQLRKLAAKYHQLRKAKEITFVKWGNSLAMRIPQEFVQEMGIKEGSHALLRKGKEGLEIISS